MPGYDKVGSNAVCQGGSQLSIAGPDWEVDKGIAACQQKCDNDASCSAFAWWEVRCKVVRLLEVSACVSAVPELWVPNVHSMHINRI